MTKHTQGPWVSRFVNFPGGWSVFWNDTSKRGVHTRRLDKSGAFSEADANLIAAAPDLLIALKNLVDDFDKSVQTTDPMLIEARAAIARAEGRT